ncbi:glycosyltransferase [Ligilactobacillus agilis]|uniref:DUF4422 domain-containing protein n=1 Tax=Ligilactobacillus agilis TaxID=1601 RepID=UPI001437DC76|nr:DUF4422 domain-containing protein [Ligilactobacillus agilis]GET15551.1 glycosyltransferase [Ligilactobacillus agilis]
MKKTVKIVIATHKKYEMPEDDIYMPVHVGAEGKVDSQGKPLFLGYTKDNTGDNISTKNDSYSELTGLYWAWKNLDTDYIGLAHYRRLFGGSKRVGKDRVKWAITGAELDKLIENNDIILPKKRHYYIETLYSHYEHTHYANQLDETREVIADLYPNYLEMYDKVLNQRSGYMFNMVIMRRDLLDKYCSWLFSILFELEKRMGKQNLSKFQGRFYGRISEIIFNVWLQYQIKQGNISKGRIQEVPIVYVEPVNWFKKGQAFLAAKFLHKRYKGSF